MPLKEKSNYKGKKFHGKNSIFKKEEPKYSKLKKRKKYQIIVKLGNFFTLNRIKIMETVEVT